MKICHAPRRFECIDAQNDFARAKAPARSASTIISRALGLLSGATESSRSKMRASAGSLRALSVARSLSPGKYSTLRRGLIAMLVSLILRILRCNIAYHAVSATRSFGQFLSVRFN